MKYALLLYEDERIYGPRADKEGPVLQGLVAKHMAFSAELGARRIGGAGLKGTAAATTVRRVGGAHTIHAGPFAEAKEQLGGFYLIDVPDLDAALARAARVPNAPYGSVEVRPIMEIPQG